ncbi:MAG TPA: hypothetical protein VLM11_13350 [Streptosporangiaceae bacterium]|nr:hypothetical protein [Streptosporangiaceae bacterium]
MSANPSLTETIPLATVRAQPRKARHISDLLLPVAAGLWAFGISETNTSVIGKYGLPPLLPIVFYAGVSLLVLSAVIELARDQLSHWRMAVHAAVLTVMLYATAPLVYSAGRYSWLYKTIGVIQYVNAHGQLNPGIDIYQNWPGFFALTAWFGKIAGVASPLAYAKWAQLVFELAALPLLYLIYDALGLTPRQRWIALLLVPASNWIGQDYLSPQALATLLCLGIMAIALRWLFVPSLAPPVPPRIRRAWSRLRRRVNQPEPARPVSPSADRVPVPASADMADQIPALALLLELGQTIRANSQDLRPGRSTPRWAGWLTSLGRQRLSYCAVILVIFFVLTITHQLSPYMLAAQLAALAAFKLLRPRWLPLVLLAVAIAYLLPRFSYVNTHYGLLNSIGNLFSNATPPALARGSVAPSQQLIEHCSEALSIGIWLLAILGAWRNWRSEKVTFALVLLAFSPAVMLAMQAYGHEGVLRVFLFSLPWATALAAMAIAPARIGINSEARPRDPSTLGAAVGGWRGPARRAARTITTRLRPLERHVAGDCARAAATFGIALTLFFPAFFGDDSFNFMSQQEVDVLAAFFQHEPPGRVYSPLDNVPLADTANYDLFPRIFLFGTYGMLQKGLPASDVAKPVSPDIAKTIALDIWHVSRRSARAYLIITPSMMAYNDQYEVTPAANFTILRSSLDKSPLWKVLYNREGMTIYELPPRPARTVAPSSTAPGSGPPLASRARAQTRPVPGRLGVTGSRTP